MRATTLIIAATVMQLLGPRPAFVKTAYAQVAVTPITEVVMYGIDADTAELLRYTFGTDEYVRIGEVVDESGNVLDDIESLTFIPSGPFRGFYGGSNYHESRPTRIVKINGMDGTAQTLPAEVGYEKVEGMVPVQNPLTGDWLILASTQHSGHHDGNHALLWIDPATGAGNFIMETEENYDGLTLAPDGTVYGVTRDGDLWTIDPLAGTETLVGGLSGYGSPEALEWAYGDFSPEITVPGVDPTWTANGLLVSFSDSDNALLIVNPATGEAVRYACSFETVDCEGVVFTTLLRDSFGAIVVDACD